MEESIKDLVDDTGYLALAINIIVFFLSLKKFRKNKSYCFITAYLLVTGIIQLLSHYLAKTYKDNGIGNLFLSHYYFISQFVILSLFYRNLFTKLQKKLVGLSISLVLIILAIRFFLNPSLYFNFDLFEIFICAIPLIAFAVIHLYNSLTESKGFLYVNASILIYISTSTLIFFLGKYLSQSNSLMNFGFDIWFLNSIFYLIFLVLIFIEWYKNYRPVMMK